MKAIIVEDDLSIALDYEMLLNKLDIRLLGTFRKVDDFLIALKKNTPDFIILDLHLEGDETGLSLARKIQHLYIPFIVITGYPLNELMEEAKELKAQAFLVKPVNLVSLEFEIRKIEEKLQKVEENAQHLIIKERGSYINIPFEDICYMEVEGNYATINTLHRRFVLKKSLSKIWKLLDESVFIKTHRGFIVNKSFISIISFSQKKLRLTNNIELPLGKNYFDGLKNYLDNKNIL